MIPGLFITGTDTDVGKTYAAAGLLRRLRERDVDAVPMKPVQTGAVGGGVPDLDACLAAAGLAPDEAERSLMAPFCYEPACSPHLAGRMAGEYPSIPRIVECARGLETLHECVLAEGAGGVLAPLDEALTMLDLMCALDYPVLLVARAGLGTINHTLLSLRALRDAGVRVLGVVFNEATPPEPESAFIRADNPRIIAALGDVTVFGTVPYGGQGDACFERIFEESR
ncbi:dethiobiotin synthase [bacterium]|nr:dethiobiotin synthase [bacterium]